MPRLVARRVTDRAPTARVADLERLLGRNSGNSSMPPSTGDLPGRTAPAGKPAGGGRRRRGKQPGAPGAFWGSPGMSVDDFAG